MLMLLLEELELLEASLLREEPDVEGDLDTDEASLLRDDEDDD